MKLQMVNWWIASGAILCVLISPMVVQSESQKGDKPMTVSSGTQVSIEYTLRLEDEAVIDTNVGSDPLTYVHGSQQIIPGLEKGLDGMKIGESRRVTVKPDEAYGPVNPEAFKEIEKEKLPPDALKVGAQLEGRDGSGQPVYARVAEVKDRTVVLDLNHPLAGKTLYFEIKVLDIQEKNRSSDVPQPAPAIGLKSTPTAPIAGFLSNTSSPRVPAIASRCLQPA